MDALLFNSAAADAEYTVTCPDLTSGYYWAADETFFPFRLMTNNNSEGGSDGVIYPAASSGEIVDIGDLINRTGGFLDWGGNMMPGIVSPGSQKHQSSSLLQQHDDEDMQRLKYYSYGIVLPAVCILGIVGNVLNLIVLTRPTMKGPAYVYMRGTWPII